MRIYKITKIIKKSPKTPINLNWLQAGRKSLHNFILANPVRKPGPVRQIIAVDPFIKKLSLKPMPIFIVALIIALISGGGAAAAAQNSLPNEVLYPVKLITEKIQETVNFDQIGKIKFQTQLTQKRLEEIQKLQEQGEVSEEVLSTALERYEKQINKVQDRLVKLDHKYNPALVATTAIEVEETISNQQEILEEIDGQALVKTKVVVIPSIASAKKNSFNSSNEILKKVEGKVKEIKEKTTIIIWATATSTTLTTTTPTTTPIIIIPGLEQRAKNRINRAENKLAEVRKKIDNFTKQKETKCDPKEKQDYVKGLEEKYQKMLQYLEEAKKLYEEKNYAGSLQKSNLVMIMAIDLSNFVGEWNSQCERNNEGVKCEASATSTCPSINKKDPSINKKEKSDKDEEMKEKLEEKEEESKE